MAAPIGSQHSNNWVIPQSNTSDRAVQHLKTLMDKGDSISIKHAMAEYRRTRTPIDDQGIKDLLRTSVHQGNESIFTFLASHERLTTRIDDQYYIDLFKEAMNRESFNIARSILGEFIPSYAFEEALQIALVRRNLDIFKYVLSTGKIAFGAKEFGVALEKAVKDEAPLEFITEILDMRPKQ